MAGLSLLLLIHQATGSLAAAGTAGGVFSAGTLTAPVKARLIDRLGQRVMLPLLGLGAAAAMLAMALLDRAAYRNPLPYPAVWRRRRGADAAGRGGDARPLVGDRRRRPEPGARLQPGRRDRGNALHGRPAADRAGGDRRRGRCCRCWSRRRCWRPGACCWRAPGPAAPARDPRPGGPAGPLAVPGFRFLLAVVLTTLLGLGAIDVTITARAVADHHPGAAGYILAAMSLGSALGGLAWGRRRHRPAPPPR